MSRFRKKPVEIEAVQIPLPDAPDRENRIWDVMAIFGGNENWRDNGKGDGGLFIITLEGEMEALPGDWIIRGIAGEFYPCKPDIFEQTYEAVK